MQEQWEKKIYQKISVKSGFFTEEEITRILWSDFEENYRAMRNPEKYKIQMNLINHIRRDQKQQE